jgi:methionyl-tRNA synthetase
MPDSAAALLDLLGQPPGQRDFSCLGVPLAPGIELPAPRAVFPRYEAPD